MTNISHSENDFLANSEYSLLGKTYNKTVNYTDYLNYTYDADLYGFFVPIKVWYDHKYILYPELERRKVFLVAYGLKRFIYLNIWVVLVILTALINVLVMWVLLQKKMRSVTNFLLVAIAMSNSLTGLFKLATVIMVYRKVDIRTPLESYDSISLSNMMCKPYVISAVFLSKSFHTISIWLTLFIGMQRYISVAYPFKTRFWFTTRRTAIVVVFICVFAPILYLYDVVRLNEFTAYGFCGTKVDDFVNFKIWITLLVLNFIPCLALTITTLLFIRNLYKNSFQPTNPMQTSSNENRRSRENRRKSMTVVAIAILSLIPELPYGLFRLYLWTFLGLKIIPPIYFKTFVWITVTYEITLVLSHHLNFYIYTFFNKRFRSYLRETLGTFSSRLINFCLSTRASSSGDERNIQRTTENKDLPDTQESTRHGNQ